ncbi:MAG: ABC-type transport auxiliary lipoprotein family protein [Pseudomonadota bacterium]
MRLPYTLSLLFVAALAGCVSVLPEPEAPDALYSINAEQRFTTLSHNLVIREPEAARLIAGQALVSEGADGGLRMIPGVEWSGPATRQIQMAMIDSFDPGASASAFAPELGVLTDYELASRLSALHLREETAICQMVVNVISSRDRTLMARTEVMASAEASSRAARDRALALQQAASDCAAQASAFAINVLSAQP